jgi:hypothetical protein
MDIIGNNTTTNNNNVHNGVDRRESNQSSLDSPPHNAIKATLSSSPMMMSVSPNRNSISGTAHINLSNNSSFANNIGQMMGAGRRRASMFDPIDPAELQKTLYQNVSFKI